MLTQAARMAEGRTTAREPTIALRKPPSLLTFQSLPGTFETISHEIEPMPLTKMVQMMLAKKENTRKTAMSIRAFITFSVTYLLLFLSIFFLDPV